MKSGTTLLRVMLGRHPDVFGGLETRWFDPEMRDGWKQRDSRRQKWFREFYDMSLEDMDRLREASHNGTEFFAACMDLCARRAGKQRWIEKTPDNVLHLSLIHECWPDAKFIHVVRDFRDVYASWKKNRSESLEQFIDKVRLVCETASPYLGQRTDFYMEVEYSALVTRPVDVMREVCRHVEAEWIPELAAFEGSSDEFDKVLKTTGKASATLENIKRPIFTDSVGQWKRMLAPGEAATIERELEPYFKLWGIPLGEAENNAGD